MWRLTTGNVHRLLTGLEEEDQIVWTDIQSDGSLIAASTDLSVLVWNFKTGELYARMSASGPRSVMFSPDGKTLLATSATGLCKWNVTDIKARNDPLFPKEYEGLTSAIAASRDGQTIVFQTPDRVLRVGSPGNLDQAAALAIDQVAHRYISVSPDGMWAATSARYEAAKAYNLKTRTLVGTFPMSEKANEMGQVVFDTTSRFLVVADPYVYRWYRVGDWKLMQSIPRLPGFVGHVAFSPDGKLIAVDGPGCSIVLLDAATRNELATIAIPDEDSIAYLSFSPDSTLLTSAGSASTVRIWDLTRIRHGLAAIQLDWN